MDTSGRPLRLLLRAERSRLAGRPVPVPPMRYCDVDFRHRRGPWRARQLGWAVGNEGPLGANAGSSERVVFRQRQTERMWRNPSSEPQRADTCVLAAFCHTISGAHRRGGLAPSHGFGPVLGIPRFAAARILSKFARGRHVRRWDEAGVAMFGPAGNGQRRVRPAGQRSTA